MGLLLPLQSSGQTWPIARIQKHLTEYVNINELIQPSTGLISGLFLEIKNKNVLPRLNYEEIGSLNRPITNKKMQSVIKNLPANKSPGQMASLVKSTFKEKLISTLLKLFQETEEEGTLPKCKRPALHYTKTRQCHKKRKLQAISLMSTDAKTP